MTKDHIAFNQADIKITLCVLVCALWMMNTMPTMIVTADMPVIEKIIMKQSACYERLKID